MKEEGMKRIQAWQNEMKAYQLALTTMAYDRLTVAPESGIEYYSEQAAYLSGVLYSIQTDTQIENVLHALKDEDLNAEQKRMVELHLKDFDRLKRIPKEDYVSYQKLAQISEKKWEEARAKKDYSVFEPYLLQIIETQKKFCALRDSDKAPYDLLLDDYEEGMNQEKYDAFFALIKEKLLPLIHEIAMKQDAVRTDFLQGLWDIEKQKQMMKVLQKYLNFDPSWGYMGISAHPFTSCFSHNDVRITNAYHEDLLLSSIFSLIHETGHAVYEHQIPESYEGTVLCNVSMGIHESQSRMYENNLGRRMSFWNRNYDQLAALYPEQLKDIDQKTFVRAVNSAKPSLIRTEADELTYPVHILIRYEIEKGIFDGTVDCSRLEEVWNEKMKEYLGVDVPDASKGILQDVHWSDGSFGYFPTYALGSAYAAQFIHAMQKDMDIDKALSFADMESIQKWQKERIHCYGASIPSLQIIKNATGEAFNPQYYIDYLYNKYRDLYQIK